MSPSVNLLQDNSQRIQESSPLKQVKVNPSGFRFAISATSINAKGSSVNQRYSYQMLINLDFNKKTS